MFRLLFPGGSIGHLLPSSSRLNFSLCCGCLTLGCAAGKTQGSSTEPEAHCSAQGQAVSISSWPLKLSIQVSVGGPSREPQPVPAPRE